MQIEPNQAPFWSLHSLKRVKRCAAAALAGLAWAVHFGGPRPSEGNEAAAFSRIEKAHIALSSDVWHVLIRVSCTAAPQIQNAACKA